MLYYRLKEMRLFTNHVGVVAGSNTTREPFVEYTDAYGSTGPQTSTIGILQIKRLCSWWIWLFLATHHYWIALSRPSGWSPGNLL